MRDEKNENANILHELRKTNNIGAKSRKSKSKILSKGNEQRMLQGKNEKVLYPETLGKIEY